MSIFGDLDIASAADDPFGVPADVYECIVTKAEVKKSAEKEYRPGVPKVGLMLTFQITSGDYTGEQVTDYKAIPVPEDPKNPTAQERKDMAWLKLRLTSLGVPESRLNSFEPDDIVGTECLVTVTRNKEYQNVSKVELPGANTSPGANPFA